MKEQGTKKQKKNIKQAQCTSCDEIHQDHPNHSELMPRLNRVEGQISGIKKMITDGRYCVDILIQFQAVAAALKAIESAVFEKHLKSCVSDAMATRDKAEVEKKTRELLGLIFKRIG